MKLSEKFKGTVLYFKDRPGSPWKQLLCLPEGTKDVKKLINEKENEFLSAYPNAEFKTEVK